MNFLINNCYLIIIAAVIIFIVGRYIYKFFNKPTEEQMNNLREWLKWAVAYAEKTLGSGTGHLKLRYVYDMFIDKFWYLSKIVSFDVFSELVDRALDEMENLLKNEEINEYVTGSDDAIKESGEHENNNNSGTQQA